MSKALRYVDPDAMLAWAAERIGIGKFRDDARAIGLESDGRLVGVCVFDSFSTCDCNMHIASDGSGHWMTAGFLRAVLAFPFVQCGLKRVSAPIAEGNERALRFVEHVGFRREGYHPDACPTGAIISTGLLRKECRHIPKECRT
jgi:RimJ/RimL family protein N-acetyltransferase